MGARRGVEPPPDLLTAQEVARRLSISVRTLYRLVQAGRVPTPMRFNRKLIRWRARDIDRLVGRARR
jgi:excisionase family DNA binding protein